MTGTVVALGLVVGVEGVVLAKDFFNIEGAPYIEEIASIRPKNVRTLMFTIFLQGKHFNTKGRYQCSSLFMT